VRKLLVIALGVYFSNVAIPAFAQSFEVASIKPNLSGSGNSGENTGRGRLTVTNDSPRRCSQAALD
jgi:hypothetical protein